MQSVSLLRKMSVALLNGGVTGLSSAASSYCSLAPSNAWVFPARVRRLLTVERAGIGLLHGCFLSVQGDAYLLAECGRLGSCFHHRPRSLALAPWQSARLSGRGLGTSPPHPILQQRVSSLARPRVIRPGGVCCTGGRASVAQHTPSLQIGALWVHGLGEGKQLHCQVAQQPGSLVRASGEVLMVRLSR